MADNNEELVKMFTHKKDRKASLHGPRPGSYHLRGTLGTEAETFREE
jgi:hypothetical protein